MSTIVIIVSPMTYGVSLGAMVDAHARLGEVFETNAALGDYAEMHTRLVLAPAVSGRTEMARTEMAGGRPLPCDTTFGSIGEVRMAYLPSFQLSDPDRIDALLRAAAPLHEWLAGLGLAGIHIGGAGASVFHLAAAGLLDGRTCVVPPRLVAAFRERFPQVRIERAGSLSVSGKIITCNRDWRCGELVIRLFAGAFSETIARSLAIREPPGDGPALFDDAMDPVVARAQLWMRDRFTRDFRIADLADELGITHQSLIRRFRAAGAQTPRSFVQRLRVEAAASMLRETNRGVSEIAQLVGYRDVASFRAVFARAYGLSPGSFRKREHADHPRLPA